jgi:hypothetical protein
VAQVVVGSIPIAHPIQGSNESNKGSESNDSDGNDDRLGQAFRPVNGLAVCQSGMRAPVAQRIRAADFGSVGRGFESLRACQKST